MCYTAAYCTYSAWAGKGTNSHCAIAFITCLPLLKPLCVGFKNATFLTLPIPSGSFNKRNKYTPLPITNQIKMILIDIRKSSYHFTFWLLQWWKNAIKPETFFQRRAHVPGALVIELFTCWRESSYTIGCNCCFKKTDIPNTAEQSSHLFITLLPPVART